MQTTTAVQTTLPGARWLAALLLLTPALALAQWPGSRQEAPAKPKEQRYGAYQKGNAATGGEGCYFGECADGTSKGGGSTRPPAPRPEPKPRPPEDGAPAPQPSPQPVPNPTPPSAPSPQATRICQTPAFWCVMFVEGPVGYPCYCNVPYPPGYVNGVSVRQR